MGEKPIKIMSMSANILRNLVSSIFKTPPQKVRLSGELEPTKTWHHESGVSYVTRKESIQVWGFCPEAGFQEITSDVVGTTHYYNGNHNQDYSPAKANLAEASIDKNFIFFVVLEEGRYDSGEDYCNYTLYEAPDFAAHWAAIGVADVERWEEWLNA